MHKVLRSVGILLLALAPSAFFGCGGGSVSVAPPSGGSGSNGGSGGSGGASSGNGPAVAVYLSTDDRSQLMAAQPVVNFGTAALAANPITVDETQTYQTVEGFGAAMTDSSAYLLHQVVPSSQLAAVMSNLFTRNGSGIGISFVRDPMGASDLSRTVYSFDDMPAGQTDPTLANFSIAHDQQDIIPLLLQARQLNPSLKIMSNPWSPPGWMKSNGSMLGGTLLSGMDTPLANYFVKYLQAYAAAGLPVDYVSLQNEPLYDTATNPNPYPGMYMDAATETTLLRDYVLPAFQSNGITTRVLVYDHNWDTLSYPQTVLADATVQSSPLVAGTAWHGYGGAPGAMGALHAAYPSLGDYETELSGGTWVADQMKTDFETITNSMRNWARSYVKWGLALDENMGPHSGGCGTCTPLVTVNSTSGAVTYDVEYYTLGHFSKFVLPGAQRIYSSNGVGIVDAAFLNPDGSKALVAYNDSNSSQTFQVNWGGQSFSYTLAPLAGATFTWSGTQTGSVNLPATTQIEASSCNDCGTMETESTSDTNGGYDLGYSSAGSSAVYKGIDFGTGVSQVTAEVASAGNGGTLEFHLDSATGPLIATVTVPVTGGWQTWKSVSANASGASGVHDLYVVFQGTAPIGNLNWFQFK